MSATEHSPWSAPTASAALDATVHLPGSKSLTNRELVLAALADGPGTLAAPLHSRDTDLMVAALRAMGTTITEGEHGPFGPDLSVSPGELHGASVDCGLAGTVMRFLPLVAALGTGDVTFDGDPHARKRPNTATIAALRALGVTVDDGGTGTLPFTVRGTGVVHGGEIAVDASASSQFISALLLVGARFQDGLTLRHTGSSLPSLPHIDMTVDVLRKRGVQVDMVEPGVWRVEPGSIAARDVTIEPDLSNAAPFLSAALVAGGTVRIPLWPASTTQVGALLPEILTMLGGNVRVEDGVCIADGGAGALAAPLTGGTIDLGHAAELSPTTAVLGAFSREPLTITGIAHVRGHETDRIAAIATNIAALGGATAEDEGSITVHPRPLTGGHWQAFADHRIATAGAIVGLAVPGVEIDDIGATSKTIPEFPGLWKAMLNT